MQRILVVEPSATLRHVLDRRLLSSNYSLDTESDYATARARLEKDAHTWSAVVIGWPSQTDAASDELLALLGEAAYRDVAVIALAQQTAPAILNWVSARERTAFLLWDSHDEVRATLDKLLSHDALPDLDHLPPPATRVLLVDDSPTARVKFRRLLESDHYQTTTAADPQEALKLAAEGVFDIAIIDYFMPEMTGDQLCRELKSNPATRHIHSAILTSTYLDKVISDSLSAGAVECMFKNESDELFLTRVAAMRRAVHDTRRIEHERRRLAGILSSVGDGVYGIDDETRINFINPAALRILGLEQPGEILGKRPVDVFHQSFSEHGGEQQEAEDLYARIRNGDAVHNIESTFLRPDGSLVQTELTVYPLRIGGEKDGAVVAFRDITERKLLEKELRWQVNHDSLTKLLNRRFFEDALEQEVRRLKRSDEKGALVYVDLDRFKYLNDTAGHIAGDQLLIEVGHQLSKCLRETDLLARIGGDEFAIILRNIGGDELHACADRFRKQLVDSPFVYNGRRYDVQASVGAVALDSNTVSTGEALANADIACHNAKKAGRNQTLVFDSMGEDRNTMDMELGWSARLRKAIDEDRFKLQYQPILLLDHVDEESLAREDGRLWADLTDVKIPDDTLYEVLLRLPDASDRLIPPGAFLPTAERFNMMPEVDYWVVDTALRYQHQLHKAGIHAGLTVNLSGQSLDSDEIITLVRRRLEQWQLEPSTLVFEITETCAIYNIDSAQRLIGELSALGCRFALDDFGSGYCSFSHLKHLPVELIKIDGMFIANLMHDPMDLAIIRSINDIAHSLGKRTVAECVENLQTLCTLKACGVDYVQGNFISRPLDLVPESDAQIAADPFASGLMSVDSDFFKHLENSD
ncbi:MAG TPA: EAL domain-containing protein [Gammaproteobacteria bacterium]|nr:EAL domain-containing protein [Gammaproteobacteria bacterium]